VGGGKSKSLNFHRKRKSWILLSVSGAVAGGAVRKWVASNGPAWNTRSYGVVPEQRGRETSLDPALFVVQTARAYRIAQEIPDILDQRYCYCECDKHLGQLSCFVDSHAATRVDICQGEALDTSQMVKKGYGIDETRRYIDNKYSKM
jgi:uncharacterized protein YbaR (Trm112 family)